MGFSEICSCGSHKVPIAKYGAVHRATIDVFYMMFTVYKKKSGKYRERYHVLC